MKLNINNLKTGGKEQSLEEMFVQVANENGINLSNKERKMCSYPFKKYIDDKICTKEECVELFKKFIVDKNLNNLAYITQFNENLDRAIILQK